MTKNVQRGYIFESSGAFHLRYAVYEGGKRKQRSAKICTKDDTYPSRESVRPLADEFITAIVAANAVNDAQAFHSCPICKHKCKRTIEGKFAPKEQHVTQDKN